MTVMPLGLRSMACSSLPPKWFSEISTPASVGPTSTPSKALPVMMLRVTVTSDGDPAKNVATPLLLAKRVLSRTMASVRVSTAAYQVKLMWLPSTVLAPVVE